MRALARPRAILEIDALTVEIVVRAGDRFAGREITAIQGRYETQGWDPCNVVYGELLDCVDVPIAVFAGTEENLAEQACLLLGVLLDVPSTYRGTEGRTVSCYEPIVG